VLVAPALLKMTSQNLKGDLKMESAIILTAVFFAVTIPLALCTRIATAYRDGTKQGNREDELIAEIERLRAVASAVGQDLAQVTEELQETRTILRGVQYYRDRLISVMQTTLGFVQLHTDRGLNWDAPYEEKLPEWFGDYDNGEIEGWEQIRKDLEEVLPRD
jgi:hypothetical protein